MTLESTGGLVAKIGAKEILMAADVVTSVLMGVAIYFKRKCDRLEKELIELKSKVKGGEN